MKLIAVLPLILLSYNFLASQMVTKTLTESFDGSGGLTLDRSGNVYIADFGETLANGNGTKVWRYNKDGTLAVFAEGFLGASGNAFDSRGNLFQANITGGYISKVTPDGRESAFASDLISCPVGVAIDAEDNLYVCNCCGTFENRVIRISPDGSTSRVYSSGSLFQCPNGIAIDEDNNLYVSNFNNGNVIKVETDGQASLLATIPGGNNGHIDYSPAHDALFVTSHGSNRIYKLSLDGNEISVIAGSGSRGNRDGLAADASFSRPNGIAVTPSGDTLYVNSSIPVTNADFPLNPSVLRQVIGLNGGLTTTATKKPDSDLFEVFRISPNPAADVLSLDYRIKSPQSMVLRLVGIDGKMLKEWKEVMQNSGTLQFDLSRYPSGVYYLYGQNSEVFISRIFTKH